MAVWSNRKRVKSPHERWPGYIVVPEELDPVLFSLWWERSIEIATQLAEEEKKVPAEIRMFEERRILILEWHIKGISLDKIKPFGSNMPSMKLISFVVAATQDLIVEARTLPNLSAPSSNTTSKTAKKKTAKKE